MAIPAVFEPVKNSTILRSTHKFNYLFWRHPWPLAKFSFLCPITQKIDFFILPIEFKKKPESVASLLRNNKGKEENRYASLCIDVGWEGEKKAVHYVRFVTNY